jgi:hypothetical protein
MLLLVVFKPTPVLSVFSGPRPVTSGGPPPPPPPPPPGLFSDVKTEEKAETKAINALFADINKGEGVTQGMFPHTSYNKSKTIWLQIPLFIF